ncbi:hypothetical protein D779_2224 [Imhoffiella purpurea]|uniref:Uncharacterized protein n=1 Tax=Imhoffiella purpurea TaxID=1249627 RepID=W9VW60_9GAMM|nr:hypothetical protein D779_2224 [Imhoffiella purpurea]
MAGKQVERDRSEIEPTETDSQPSSADETRPDVREPIPSDAGVTLK